MPIRLNLLAEMHAMEEVRRRDPVKRAILAGVVLVAAVLVWSSTLMVQQMSARSELAAAVGNNNSKTNDYLAVVSNETRLAGDKSKLQALQILTSNRFLNGTLLDVLQRTLVDNVQVTRLKVNQTYILTEEQKAAKSGDDEDTSKKPAVTKPATVTEKISLSITATDTSRNGEAATRYQDALSAAPYFQKILARTNGFRLTSIGAPQVDPNGQSFTTFSLEAHLPDKTR